MSIVGISDNLQSIMPGLDIEQLLRKKKGDEIIPDSGADLLNAEDSLAAEIAAERHSVTAGQSSNPLDRNFVRKDKEDSRYVNATLKGLKASREMDEAKQSSATALLEEFGGVNVSGTYFAPKEAHSENWYKQRLKDKTERELLEDAAERLRRERREEKEQVEEALLAPKDSEGNPVDLPAASGTPAPLDSGSTEVALDAASSASAPAEVAVAPAAAAADTAAIQVQDSEPTPKVAASIDITV